MAEFTGKNMYAQWVYSGGTVNLQSNFRTFSWNPSKTLHDATAGSDPAQHQIVGIQNASAAIGMVAQEGGTATVAALAFGNYGTLTVGVEGTASGKPKIILPAMSQGAKVSAPYGDIVEITCDFIQDGGTYTEGSW